MIRGLNERCEEHGLYLYFVHYGKNNEEYYTCKLGCIECVENKEKDDEK